MPQVVEHAHEQDQIELFTEFSHPIHVKFTEFNICLCDLSRESGLRQISGIGVDTHYARSAAPFHFERVEPPVAANVEHGLATQIGRNRVSEGTPLTRGIIPE